MTAPTTEIATIEIQTHNKGPQRCEITGQVGQWAWHRTWHKEPLDEVSWAPWSVSHVPVGFRSGMYLDEASAARAAKYLSATVPEFADLSGWEDLPNATRKDLKQALSDLGAVWEAGHS